MSILHDLDIKDFKRPEPCKVLTLLGLETQRSRSRNRNGCIAMGRHATEYCSTLQCPGALVLGAEVERWGLNVMQCNAMQDMVWAFVRHSMYRICVGIFTR